jgi:hypothetical protein
MEFISLKTLVFDLLNIIRGSKPIDDEPISEKQIESWLHQYRAMFLKRDIDKGKMPNPDYVQTIDDISLEYDSTKEMYRSSIDIPNTLDFNHKSGITFVGDKYGNQLQLIPEKRINYQKYNKWTQDDTLAFLSNNRIYLYNSKGLDTFYLRGIFENPIEAAEANGDTYNYDSPYPVPMSMVNGIKKDILKNELGIEWQAPSDEVNNAEHTVA